MAIYSVHNLRGAAAGDTIFVKEGFAWGAFLFTLIWALLHRMWIVAGLVFAFIAGVWACAEFFSLGALPTNLAGLAGSLILGFEGNDLRRWSLARRGYNELTLVAGRDLYEAELRYFAEEAAEEAMPAPARFKLQPQGHDPLGLFGSSG